MRGAAQVFSSARNEPDRKGGSTDDWGTPQKFYDLLHGEFNFELDPCARDETIAKCDLFITPELDGLKFSWEKKTAFVNFPYSNAKEWALKCVVEAGHGSTVVVLCAARTDTAWWQALARRAAEVRFIKGRLSFVGPAGQGVGAPFPSSVIVLRPGCQQWNTDKTPQMRLWDVPSEVRR